MIRIKNTNDVVNDGFFALIAGDSGAGKTVLGASLPESNTCFISKESGLLSIKKTGKSFPVIEIDDWSDFISAAKGIKEGSIHKAFGRTEPFKNYYIDSLTDIMDTYVEQLKGNYTDKKDTFKMWDMYTSTAIHYIKFLRDCKGVNIFFTCLTTKEKDGMELIDEFDFSGAKLKSKIKSFFDEAFHLITASTEEGNKRFLITDEAESRLAKDRSGLLESKIEVPENSKLLTDIMLKILA